jgi:lipoprotein-anchoring transpeptidase ErfK/SrfK
MAEPTLGPSTTPSVAPFIPERARIGAGTSRRTRIAVLITGVMLVAVLLGSGLYGLFNFINQSRAMSSKASLDRALVDASANGHVPALLLQPIQAKEQQIAASSGGTPWGWDHANSQYVQLQTQVSSIVNMPPQQARTLTEKDLTKLSAAVTALANDKYQEAPGYQKRQQQAQDSLTAAKTTKDIFTVDNFVLDQIAALAAFKPTLDRLNAFETLVQNEQDLLGTSGPASQQDLMCAVGYPWQFWDDTYGTKITTQKQPVAQLVEVQWVNGDWTLFRAAASSQDYTDLNVRLQGQTAQVQANQAALLPSYAAHVLDAFQSDIQLIKKYGGSSKDIATYQQQYDKDVQMLQGAPAQETYLAVVKQVQKQHDAIQLPLVKAQTQSDVKTLQGLIAQGQKRYTHNPADGKNYPNAYEYADPGTGIGDITNKDLSKGTLGRLYTAKTLNDYQLIDQELQMFIHNIQAMLQNLNDPLTKANKWNVSHQTDTQLIQYYGLTSSGKVMVVSLREQAARFYDNGKFVKAIQVTTGAPDLPSVAGIHCALSKDRDTIFKSPDPPGSPHYYKPTPVHFAMYYAYAGFEVHDAWWRNQFGLYTNLPHYDPAAFNGGSHGCINVNYNNGDMAWVFNWMPWGAPIIVY